MKYIDDIEKYANKDYNPSLNCRNYTVSPWGMKLFVQVCEKCGKCGRKFENGVLKGESK